MDKQIAQKRWRVDSRENENFLNFLSGRYVHIKIIPKGVLRHAEIPRDIKE